MLVRWLLYRVQRGLTPRSSGAPTAGHQARSGGTPSIFTGPGLASCRWRPLSSNVRQHKRGRAVHQQNQRLRREPNSHESGIAASSRMGAATHRVGRPTRVANANTSYSAPSLWLSLQQNDLEPPCQTNGPFFVGSVGLQSVPRAAAANAGAPGLGPLVRRLQFVACHGLRRGAGSTCGGPQGVTGPWRAQRLRSPGEVLPNPSLKRSANGRPPGPGRRYGVHFRHPGPGVLPSSPA